MSRQRPAYDFVPAAAGAMVGVALAWTSLLALGWWMARKALAVGR